MVLVVALSVWFAHPEERTAEASGDVPPIPRPPRRIPDFHPAWITIVEALSVYNQWLKCEERSEEIFTLQLVMRPRIAL
jgi:hypothetical protein